MDAVICQPPVYKRCRIACHLPASDIHEMPHCLSSVSLQYTEDAALQSILRPQSKRLFTCHDIQYHCKIELLNNYWAKPELPLIISEPLVGSLYVVYLAKSLLQLLNFRLEFSCKGKPVNFKLINTEQKLCMVLALKMCKS
jgi:hypothetical protein